MENIDLSLELFMCFDLVRVLSLYFLGELVLLVQRLILALNDVHLEDCAAGVLLCADDFHLTSVVFDFGHNINENLLQTLDLTTESHRVFALKAENSLRTTDSQRSVRSYLAVATA